MPSPIVFLVPILISLGAFAMVFGIVYLAKRERLAMIEKGMDPRNRKKSAPGYLKWGMLLIGAGLGLGEDLFGFRGSDGEQLGGQLRIGLEQALHGFLRVRVRDARPPVENRVSHSAASGVLSGFCRAAKFCPATRYRHRVGGPLQGPPHSRVQIPVATANPLS